MPYIKRAPVLQESHGDDGRDGLVYRIEEIDDAVPLVPLTKDDEVALENKRTYSERDQIGASHINDEGVASDLVLENVVS